MKPRHLLLALAVAIVVATVFLFFRRHDVVAAQRKAALAEARRAEATASLPSSSSSSWPALQGGSPIRGDLRLDGQVVDDESQPVPKAKVVLSGDGRAITTAEDDGSFHFDALARGSYTLFAYARDGIAGPVSTRLVSERDPVILRIARASTVVVKVIDRATQQAISGATVEVRAPMVATAVSEAGVAKLSPVPIGDFQVMATAHGYAKTFAYVHVAGAGSTVTIGVALERGARLSGTVLNPAGSPVGGARVLWSGQSQWGNEPDADRDGVTTDEEGRFAFESVAAGTVRLRAERPPSAPAYSEPVTLDGVRDRQVVLRLAEAITVQGLVVDAAGAPLPFATITLFARGEGAGQAGARRATSDERGAFTFTAVPRRALLLHASHAQGTSGAVNVAPGTGSTLAVRLKIDQTLEIAGVVVDTSGAPVESAQVVAHSERPVGAFLSSAEWRLEAAQTEITDGAGHFVLRGLAAGKYVLRAARRGGRGQGLDELAEGVTVAAGAHDARVVLPRGGAIKGRVAFADGHVPETFAVSLSGRAEVPFGFGDGTFTIDGLPPRSYSVMIRGPGFAGRIFDSVQVSENGTADLGPIELQRGRTISGIVTRDGQPVAAAHVRAGAMLFGDGSSGSPSSMPSVAGGESTKETQTDASGQFLLAGIGDGRIFVAAEAPDGSRAQPLELPSNGQSLGGLELTLQGTGSLTGRVTRGGEPVGDVIVNARASSAIGVFYGVSSGADGEFRFDRLAPGNYKVSAMTSNLGGMNLQAVGADISTGKETRVTIELPTGDLELDVTLDGVNGNAGFATVTACEADIAPRTAAALVQAMAAVAQGHTALGIVFSGQPAALKQLSSGRYTVCAVPYPPSISDLNSARLCAERDCAQLPVYCQKALLTDAPPQQSLHVQVQIPPDHAK